MNIEKERKKTLQINYKVGNYDFEYCSNCGSLIEEYKNIKSGLCEECREEDEYEASINS